MAELPSGYDVAAFLGRGDDAALVALAGEHVPLVVAFVREYVRGVGFEAEPDVPESIAAVILTSCARLVVNPSQVRRERADTYEAVGSFNGFSLPELAVLHNYRRRTA